MVKIEYEVKVCIYTLKQVFFFFFLLTFSLLCTNQIHVHQYGKYVNVNVKPFQVSVFAAKLTAVGIDSNDEWQVRMIQGQQNKVCMG
jgi:hypothetical protein